MTPIEWEKMTAAQRNRVVAEAFDYKTVWPRFTEKLDDAMTLAFSYGYSVRLTVTNKYCFAEIAAHGANFRDARSAKSADANTPAEAICKTLLAHKGIQIL